MVLSVPGILGAHHIRTRGSSDHVFLDLHVWLTPDMRLDEAHAVSHVVKDRLIERYPQIADAVHPHRAAAGWMERRRASGSEGLRAWNWNFEVGSCQISRR